MAATTTSMGGLFHPWEPEMVDEVSQEKYSGVCCFLRALIIWRRALESSSVSNECLFPLSEEASLCKNSTANIEWAESEDGPSPTIISSSLLGWATAIGCWRWGVCGEGSASVNGSKEPDWFAVWLVKPDGVVLEVFSLSVTRSSTGCPVRPRRRFLRPNLSSLLRSY